MTIWTVKNPLITSFPWFKSHYHIPLSIIIIIIKAGKYRTDAFNILDAFLEDLLYNIGNADK